MDCEEDIDFTEDLFKKGQNLLNAAHEYYTAFKREKPDKPRGVIWLQGTGGELVAFTLGEYTETLKDVVHKL